MVARRNSKQLTKSKKTLKVSQPKYKTKLITRCARKKSVQSSEDESLSTDDNTDSDTIFSESIATQSCSTAKSTEVNDIPMQDVETNKSLISKVVQPKKDGSKIKTKAKSGQTQLNKIIVSEENINKENTEHNSKLDIDKATTQLNSKSNILNLFDNQNTLTYTNTVKIQQCTNINNATSDKTFNEEDDESSGASIIYHLLEFNKNLLHGCKLNKRNTETLVINQLSNTETHLLYSKDEGNEFLKAYKKFNTQCFEWISIMSKVILKEKSLNYLSKQLNLKVEIVRWTVMREFRLIDDNNNVILDAAGQCKLVRQKSPYYAARELAKHYKLKKCKIFTIEDALDTTFRREYVVSENENNNIKIFPIKM